MVYVREREEQTASLAEGHDELAAERRRVPPARPPRASRARRSRAISGCASARVPLVSRGRIYLAPTNGEDDAETKFW